MSHSHPGKSCLIETAQRLQIESAEWAPVVDREGMTQGTRKRRKSVPTHRSPKRPERPRPVETGPGNNRDPFGISIEVLSTVADKRPKTAMWIPRGFDCLIQCFRAYVDANPDRFTVQVKDVGGKCINFVTLAKGEQN